MVTGPSAELGPQSFDPAFVPSSGRGEALDGRAPLDKFRPRACRGELVEGGRVGR